MKRPDGPPQRADGPLAPLIARLAPLVATAKSKEGKATTLPPLDEPLAKFHEWLIKLQEADSLSPELAKDASVFLSYQCFAYTVSSATVAAAVDGKEDEAGFLKNKAVAMLEVARDLIECLASTVLESPGGLPTRAGAEGDKDKKVYGDLLLALLDGLCDHLDPHNAYQKQPAPEDLAYRGLFGEILLPSLYKLVFPDPAGLPSASGRAISDGAKGGKIRAEIKYASFAIVSESTSKHPANKERIRRIFPPDHIASILQGGYDAHLSTAAFECAFCMAPSRRSPAERADFIKQLFAESRFGKSAQELRASFDRINGNDLYDKSPMMLSRISNGSIKRSQPFRAFSLKYNGRPLLTSKREESSHNVLPANEPSLKAIADCKAYDPAIVWFSTDILAAAVPEPPEIVKMRRAGDPRPDREKAVQLDDSSESFVRMVIDLGAVERVHVQDLGKDPNVAKITILISAGSPARFGNLPHPSLALHVGTSLKSLDESQVGSRSESMHKLEMIFPAGNDNLNILKKTLVARKERYPKLGDELHRFPIRVGVSPPNKAPEKPSNAKSAAKPASKPAAKPASKAEETTKNVAFAPTPSPSIAATACAPAVKRAPRKSSEAGPVVAQPAKLVANGAAQQVEPEQRGEAAAKGEAKLEKVREEDVNHLAASQEAARRRAAEVAGLAELDKASSVATSQKTRSTDSEMRGVEENALAGQEFGGGFEEGEQAKMDVDGAPAGEGDEGRREEDTVKHKTPANTRRLEGDVGRAPGRRRKEAQPSEDEGQDDVTPSQQRQTAKSGDLASSDLSEPATEAADVDEVEQPVKKKKVVQPAKKGRGGAGNDGDKKAKKAKAETDTQSLASGRPRRAAASKAVANLRGQKRASTPLEEEEEEEEDEDGEDEHEVEPEKPAVKKGKKVKKASPPPAKRRKTSPTPSDTAEESGEETDYDDFPGGDVASTLEEKKVTVRPAHKYGKEVNSIVRSMGGKRKAGKPVAKAKAAPPKAKKRKEQETATEEEASKASERERSTSPILKPNHHGPKKHVVEQGGTDLEDERNAEPVRPAKQDKRIADDIPPPRDLTQGELERAKELDPRARRASRAPEEKSPAKPIRSFSALVGREDGASGHQRLGEHIIEGVGRLTAESEDEAEEENVFEAGPFPDELDDFSAIATGKQVQAATDTVRRQVRSSPSPFIDPAREQTFVERAVAEASTSGGQLVVAAAAQAVVVAQKRPSPAPATARQAEKDANLSPTAADDSGVHFQLPLDLGDEAAEEEMVAKTHSVVQQIVAPNHELSGAKLPTQSATASNRRDVQAMLVEKPSQARAPLSTMHPFAPAADVRRHRSLSPGTVGAHATPAVPPKATASANWNIAAAAIQQAHIPSPALPFTDQRARPARPGPSMMQVPSKQAGDPFSEREEQATTSAAAQPAKASTSRPQQHHVGTASPWGGLGRPIGRDEGLVGGTASTSSKKPVSAPPAFTSVSGGASTLRKAPKPKQHVKGRLGSNGVFGQQQRRAKNGKAREKAPLLPPISPSLSSEVDFGAEVKSDWQGGEYEMDAFLTKFFRDAIVEKQAEQRRQREAHHQLSRQRLMGKLGAYVDKARKDAIVIADNMQARLDAADQPDSLASNLRRYAKHAYEVNMDIWEEAQRELEKIAAKEQAEAEAEAKKGK
ncbi:RHTO0S01e03224g1_1 [Rhodotorula toruloides]|uniref:RHTO0S01e03224g1_1 n=1 Tax=Rhodotorula toruloides TaxID=5286 RepID=A0A061ADH5_RHOTO|nr:RHTO0S01e03224g1_1 [Rhodotorula toruloides]